MTSGSETAIGSGQPDAATLSVLLPHNASASHLVEFATMVEDLGFSSLWIPENSFLAGAVPAAAIALSATSTLRVGLGVLPAPTRHPATAAMDIATLSNAFPGRLIPGVGLGVPAWLDRMGVRPARPLAFLADYVTALRALLDGQTYSGSITGSAYQLDAIALDHPPNERLRLAIGVVGAKMLALAGAQADVAILSTLSGPRYLGWATEILRTSAAAAGRPVPHRACFVSTSIHPDRQQATQLIRADLSFVLAAMGVCALTTVLGIDEELEALLAEGGREALAAQMPDAWIEEMSIVGTQEDFVARLSAYLDSGVDELVVSPKPVGRTGEVLRAISQAVGLRGRQK